MPSPHPTLHFERVEARRFFKRLEQISEVLNSEHFRPRNTFFRNAFSGMFTLFSGLEIPGDNQSIRRMSNLALQLRKGERGEEIKLLIT